MMCCCDVFVHVVFYVLGEMCRSYRRACFCCISFGNVLLRRVVVVRVWFLCSSFRGDVLLRCVLFACFFCGDVFL